jgi:excisionase family DNA binding protein
MNDPGPNRLAGDLHKKQKALTVADVADLLQVSQRHVYKLVQTGEIPHFKIGASVRFDPCLLADWVKARVSAPAGKKR